MTNKIYVFVVLLLISTFSGMNNAGSSFNLPNATFISSNILITRNTQVLNGVAITNLTFWNQTDNNGIVSYKILISYNQELSYLNKSSNTNTINYVTPMVLASTNNIHNNNTIKNTAAYPSNSDPAGVNFNNFIASPRWSGWAVESNFSSPAPVVTGVNASWLVQEVPITTKLYYSNQWVGIGDVAPGDSSLIQVGTQSDSGNNQNSSYGAWYETIEPGVQIGIGGIVTANDEIVARINNSANVPGSWKISIIDLSKNWVANTIVSGPIFVSSMLSGEFIEERPIKATALSISPCNILNQNACPTLNSTDFGVSRYGHLYSGIPSMTDFATVNGVTAPIGSFDIIPIIMFNGSGTNDIVPLESTMVLEQPTQLSPDGTSFNVIYGTLGTPIVSSPTTSIYFGQSVLLSATEDGGTSSANYIYQWYNLTTGKPIAGATSDTYLARPLSNTIYQISVNDTGLYPNAQAQAFSNTIAITVLPSTTTTTIPYAPPAPAISPPSASVDQGQGLSFRAVDGSLNGINRALWQLWNGTAGTVVQGITTPANATAVNFTQITPYYNTTYSVSVAYINATNATITNRTYSPSVSVTVYPRQ